MAKNEADGTRMVRALLTEWLAQGALPARLEDLPKEALPDTLRYWRYRASTQLPLWFEVWIGNYDLCGWEMSIGFHTRWHVPPDEVVGAEALELLKIILRRYLADGSWPASHEALGLPAEWGAQGVWQYEPPRQSLDRWAEMIPGYLFLQRPTGPELTLEFQPPELYYDT